MNESVVWCIVHGCTNGTQSRYTGKRGYICDAHWRKLPIKLRQQWWKETEYGAAGPSEELKAAINQAILEATT